MYVSVFQLHKPGMHEVSLTPAQRPVEQIPSSQLPEGMHETRLVSQRIHPALLVHIYCMHSASYKILVGYRCPGAVPERGLGMQAIKHRPQSKLYSLEQQADTPT